MGQQEMNSNTYNKSSLNNQVLFPCLTLSAAKSSHKGESRTNIGMFWGMGDPERLLSRLLGTPGGCDILARSSGIRKPRPLETP